MSHSPGTSPSALEQQMVGTLTAGQEPLLENEVEQPGGAEDSPVARPEGTSQEPDEGPSPTSERSEGAETAEAKTDAPPAKPKRVLGYDDLLPLEQGDEYPEQLYEIAAKKWNIPVEDLQKPWTHNLLTDKINSDILNKRQRHDAALRAAEPTPTEEPGDEEPPLEETSQPFDMTKALATSTESVSSLITKEGSAAYSGSLIAALKHVNAAEESGDDEDLAKAYQELTTSQFSMLHMALQSLLPGILPSAIQGYATKVTTADEKQRKEAETIYAKARDLVSQDPDYSDLDDLYGTEEVRRQGKGEFQKLLDELPELSTMHFRGKDGKFLGKVENAVAQYKYGVRFIRGKSPRPNQESFKRGVEAGKKGNEQAKLIAGAGKLGQGRPTSGGFATGQSDKDFQKRLVDRFNSDNPFAGNALGGGSSG